jgi:hypothetical protein
MRNKPFVFLLLLLSAPCAPARPDAPASAATDTRPGRAPEEVVREFYEWYLGELRGGREPFKDEERMRQYVTDDFIRERAGGPPDLDPVFGLAKSDADWPRMKFGAAKPKFYKGETYEGRAYVDVTTKGRIDGRDFTGLSIVGLRQTKAGWRVASVSEPD